MGIDLIADIQPKNAGAFPTHSDIYQKGGFQVRSTTVDRDSIPALNRKEGMLVYVISSATTYRLGVGLLNADWVEVTSGGAVENVFIYREGGVASGNVYTSLDAAYAPALALQDAGIPCTIYIDGALGNPVSGVGSTYYFDAIALEGLGSNGAGLVMQEGSHIKRLGYARKIDFENASSTSIWDVTVPEAFSPNPVRLELHDCSFFSPGLTPVPFFEIKVNVEVWFSLYGTTAFGQGSGTVGYQEGADLTGKARFWLYDRAIVENDSITGGSVNLAEYALFINVVSPAAVPPATLSGFLFLIQGWTVQYLSEASRITATDTAPLLGAVTVQGQLDAVKARGGTTFVYRQGGVASGNVYTSFLAAYNAAFALGVPCAIALDDSIAPCVTGAIGLIDLSRIDLICDPLLNAGLRPTLTFQTGTTVTKFRNFFHVILRSTSTSAVCTLAVSTLMFLERTAFVGGTAAPFFHMTAGAFLTFWMGKFSALINGTDRVVQVDVGAGVVAELLDQSATGTTVFGGAGDAFILSSSLEGAFSTTQVNITGTYSIILLSVASKAKYIDTAPVLVPVPVIPANPSLQEATDALKDRLPLATAVGPVTHVLVAGERVIACDPTAGAVGVTLPAAPPVGRTVDVKDETGFAATNNITITALGGFLIEQPAGADASTLVLATNKSSVTLCFSGARWMIL